MSKKNHNILELSRFINDMAHQIYNKFRNTSGLHNYF